MGWRQLEAIQRTHRRRLEEAAEQPPIRCPHDGIVLQRRDDGVVHCPAGNYIWES